MQLKSFFNFLLLFNYSCLLFLPIPPPHSSRTHLPPLPPPSPLICSSNLHILTQPHQSRKKKLYPLMFLEFFSEALPTSPFIWLSRWGRGPLLTKSGIRWCGLNLISHGFSLERRTSPCSWRSNSLVYAQTGVLKSRKEGYCLLGKKPRMSATMLHLST